MGHPPVAPLERMALAMDTLSVSPVRLGWQWNTLPADNLGAGTATQVHHQRRLLAGQSVWPKCRWSRTPEAVAPDMSRGTRTRPAVSTFNARHPESRNVIQTRF
jgi:hypothetical protein